MLSMKMIRLASCISTVYRSKNPAVIGQRFIWGFIWGSARKHHKKTPANKTGVIRVRNHAVTIQRNSGVGFSYRIAATAAHMSVGTARIPVLIG